MSDYPSPCPGGGVEPSTGVVVEAVEGQVRAQCPACDHYVLLSWSREGGRPVARLRAHHEPVQVECPACFGTGVTADDVFARLSTGASTAVKGCPTCFGNGDLWEVGDGEPPAAVDAARRCFRCGGEINDEGLHTDGVGLGGCDGWLA